MEAPSPSKRLRRDPPSPNKRLRRDPPSPRLRRDPPPSSGPTSLPSVPDLKQNHVDLIISSFLSLTDSPSFSSSPSITNSFDRAIKKLVESSADESVQDRISDRGLRLASLLHESTKRCARKLAADRNSSSWRLPYELTVQVFSMLDKKSLTRASACCTMFKKCAMDPSCYSHIELPGSAGNRTLRRMLLNGGKELRSLIIGCRHESSKSNLSGSCLAPLSNNHGFLGKLLRSLHLYDNGWLDKKYLLRALSECSNLTELKIVGLWYFSAFAKVLDLLTSKCEHLFLEKIGYGRLTFNDATPLERNCCYLTSLSLIGFDLGDVKTYHLVKGLTKLKYLNISKTYSISGGFLSHFSNDFKGSLLETLIMRDCNSLEEIKVCEFLDFLLMSRTNFRSIQHIDVSNDRGLINDGRRCRKPKFPLEELREGRPGLTFVACFRSPSPSSSSSLSYSSSSSSTWLSPSASSSSSSESEDE
ncbi:F-box domain-containing protein [Hirschfeldia incana]|nr:F-box domain-containing protein [Hirschfeldia incana]